MKKQLHKMLLPASCILLLAMLQLSPYQVKSQTNRISGTVTNKANEPVQGATIMVKQSKKLTATDANGKFTVEANPGQTLVITNVGYESQEVVTRGAGNVSVSLLSNISTMNDLVVVAYGTQKRKDITGSVAIVNMAETKKYSTSDVAQLLQGRASGVAVNSDGQPGATPSVRIRGIGTFGNSQPLYVIDGVQVGTVVRDFSPNDIESIQVLKDASAGALYGSAAANGVIIITTKQGKKKCAA
ncbi:MAG: TonB-dependent receptor plug domain-containing protein [Ferruginibacter sp.]